MTTCDGTGKKTPCLGCAGPAALTAREEDWIMTVIYLGLLRVAAE